jgi:hypothetical protein
MTILGWGGVDSVYKIHYLLFICEALTVGSLRRWILREYDIYFVSMEYEKMVE